MRPGAKVKAFCKAGHAVSEESVDRALRLLDEADERLDPTLKGTLYQNARETKRMSRHV